MESIWGTHRRFWNASLRRPNRPKPSVPLPDLPGGLRGNSNMKCSRGHGRFCRRIRAVSLTTTRLHSGRTVLTGYRHPESSPTSRLLKKVPNFVLGSSQSSTYPRGYASGCDSPAASLDDLFEQPAESDCCALFSTAVSLSNFLSIRLASSTSYVRAASLWDRYSRNSRLC